MRILPRCIEHALNVTIERPHHADARKHCWPAKLCDQDQGFHRGLPFRGRVFRLWQLGDVGAGVVQGDEPAAVRQRDRIVEEASPGQSSILLRDPDRKYARSAIGSAIALRVPHMIHLFLAACHAVHVMFSYSMDASKEREIIRLWNRLRLLEKEGRQTTAVRRQIEKALAERESHAG